MIFSLSRVRFVCLPLAMPLISSTLRRIFNFGSFEVIYEDYPNEYIVKGPSLVITINTSIKSIHLIFSPISSALLTVTLYRQIKVCCDTRMSTININSYAHIGPRIVTASGTLWYEGFGYPHFAASSAVSGGLSDGSSWTIAQKMIHLVWTVRVVCHRRLGRFRQMWRMAESKGEDPILYLGKMGVA